MHETWMDLQWFKVDQIPIHLLYAVIQRIYYCTFEAVPCFVTFFLVLCAGILSFSAVVRIFSWKKKKKKKGEQKVNFYSRCKISNFSSKQWALTKLLRGYAMCTYLYLIKTFFGIKKNAIIIVILI